jgi:ketosteroid isomerase-like protein
VAQVEFPNRLVPQAATCGFAELREAAQRGNKAMSSQCYEVLHAVASGEHVAIEASWTGTLAVPLCSLPLSGQMRARFAILLSFRDGKIMRQHNYDRFDAW